MAGKGRHDGGGRRKGSPNKRTVLLIEKAAYLKVDPFEILLLVAKGDWQGLGYEFNPITLGDRLAAATQACQYLYPKRKAIDVIQKTNIERPYGHLTDEELDAVEITDDDDQDDQS